MILKICTDCKIEKDISEFGTRQRKIKNNIKIYPSIYCKICANNISKLWRRLNSDKVKQQNQSPNCKASKKKC
jgi:hypothetical protein